MKREAKVRWVTVAVLTIVFALAVANHMDWSLPGSAAPAIRPASSRDAGPRDTIYRMLEAAREGDADTYIACYSAAMERRLQQSRREMTAAGFAAYLIERNRRIKGVVVFDPDAVTESEARVRVEYVYQNRNEAQSFHLDKLPGGWKISEVDEAQHVEAPVPYGTPVY